MHSLSQPIHAEEMEKENEKGDQGLIKEGEFQEEKEVKTIWDMAINLSKCLF